MDRIDWIRGDAMSLEIPAHSAALQQGGAEFLTRAFQLSGSLPADNRVARITEFKEVFGGSTGRKLLLSLEYEKPSANLHTQLFVKFSRDFDDEARDQARSQMELEVLFALLSRSPEFPIDVPVCYFSDYHHASGTGILITQRIPYDVGGVEPQYPKCLDYQMPDQLGHYQALIKALARLAGTHKAGKLPDVVENYFPFDPTKLVVSQRASYTPEQIRERVARYSEFAKSYPQLLPENIRTDAFLQRLADEAPRFQALEKAGNKILQSRRDMIALCHWNAHIDNAWFWRNDENIIECGLMDWGNVSQMNVAMALWGCLSGAEIELWNNHLDELLQLFIDEFKSCGGPAIDFTALKLHLTIYVALMGLNWMLDSVRLISKTPDLANAKNRFDARIQSNERVRSQLLIMSAFLNRWQKENMNNVISYLETFA
ncbi:MAG: hypothetical protein QM709_10025 [Spongiibacteraceae bacterium]